MNRRVTKLAFQLLLPLIGGAAIGHLALHRPDDHFAKTAAGALAAGTAATGAAVLVLGANNRRRKLKTGIGSHQLPTKAATTSSSLPQSPVTQIRSLFNDSSSSRSALPNETATASGAERKQVLISVNRTTRIVRVWAHGFSAEEFPALRRRLESVSVNWSKEKRQAPSLVQCRGEFAPDTEEDFENGVAVPLLALGSVYNGRGSEEEVSRWFSLES
jgi:hypothetical protein